MNIPGIYSLPCFQPLPEGKVIYDQDEITVDGVSFRGDQVSVIYHFNECDVNNFLSCTI